MVQIVRSRKESPGRKGKKESPPRQWLQMPAPNSKARRANSVVTAIAGQDRYVADPTFSSAELGPGVSVASECVFCALCSNTHRRTHSHNRTQWQLLAPLVSFPFLASSQRKVFIQPPSARVEDRRDGEATKISQRKNFKRCRCFFRLPAPSGRTGRPGPG